MSDILFSKRLDDSIQIQQQYKRLDDSIQIQQQYKRLDDSIQIQQQYKRKVRANIKLFEKPKQ
jgi:hypothetical protein